MSPILAPGTRCEASRESYLAILSSTCDPQLIHHREESQPYAKRSSRRILYLVGSLDSTPPVLLACSGRKALGLHPHRHVVVLSAYTRQRLSRLYKTPSYMYGRSCMQARLVAGRASVRKTIDAIGCDRKRRRKCTNGTNGLMVGRADRRGERWS